MENNAPKKKQFPAYLILTIIAVVAAVVLALTNQVTAGPIAEHAMAALKDAFNAVLPAEKYEEVTVPASQDVASLYAAKNGDEVIGYCVTASAQGYGGPVAVTLGVDAQGVVTGCAVGDTSFAETAGIGTRAQDPAFRAQFEGISAVDGGAVEALSGATVTSTAVRTAVNKGLKCVAEVVLNQQQNAEVTFGAPAAKEEKPAQTPDGDALTASAPGFAGQDVGVTVTLDAEGNIATLSFDMSKQAPPICDMCDTDEFKANFIGKKGPFEGVDVVTGATYTSQGIIDALNKLFEAQTAFAPAETRTASAPGFAGQDVTVTALMNADGTIAELSFDMSKQAPPICDMCDTDEFKANFIGKSGPFEGVDVVTGATYTSQGIIDAVNAICAQEPVDEAPATVLAEGDNAALAVKDDGAALVTPAEGYTGDVSVNLTVEDGKVTAGEFAAPSAGEVEGPAAVPAPLDDIIGTAEGFQSDVNVAVTLAEDGTIASLSIGSANETPGFGTRCAEDEAFISQFIGKTGPFAIGEGIDALSGATVTSKAVVEALNIAMSAVQPAGEETVPAGEELTASAEGFQSDVEVTLTVADGVITAIKVNSANETPGFGTRCGEDEAFLNQFIGKKATPDLGEGIDALSGATVTSKAVIEAANAAIGVEEAVVEPAVEEVVEEVPAEEAAPAGEELTASAEGFQSDVEVTLTVADGVITAIKVNSANETPGFGTRCGEDEAFLNQFIGKKATPDLGEGIDALSGATVTSKAVIEAANAAIGVEEAVVEPAVEEVVEEVPAEEAAPAGEELTASAEGFQSDVEVTLTVADGVITAIKVNSANETPGFGTRCGEDEAFLNQFIGKKATPDLGEGIDALSGATVTSKAVIEAANAAIGVEEAVVEPAVEEVVEEVPAEEAAPAGEELTASAEGFQSDVEVTLTVADGVITAIKVNSANETPGFGTRCGEDEAFLNQFIGKKATPDLGEGIDALSGATVTSKAVIEAINGIVGAAQPAEEATGTDLPAAELTATAPGFLDSEVGVTVSLAEDGTIATLTLDLSKQVPPVCDLCDTEEFKANFIGKKGPFEGVDVVTGATYTSEGVIEALNSLFQ